MAISLFKSLIGYLFSNDEKMAEHKPLKYVAAGNGTFEVRDNPLMQVTKKLDGVPNLPVLEEGIKLHVPKIPFDIFNRMVSFMKKIYEDDTTESTIMVFYNKENGEFIPWVPLQENGGASSDYKRDDDPDYTRMCKDNILVMVAHSHPWASTTGPSPSGTDDRDEKEAMLYMVVGNVKGIPTTTVSTCPGGKRIKLKFFEAFENPLLAQGSNPLVETLLAKYVPDNEVFPVFVNTSMEVPDEWLERCTKKVYTYTGYYGGGYWSGKGPGSQEDPHRQYQTRYGTGYDYDDYYDGGYGDCDTYTNYYYQQRRNYAQDSVFEDMSDEEIEAEYNKRLVNPTSVSAHVDDEIDDDDVAILEVADVIDACLDFTDIQIAQVMLTLISEGKGSLLDKCLKANEQKKLTAGAKSSDAPGVKLIKHGDHKGGNK